MDDETTYTTKDMLAFAYEQRPIDFDVAFKQLVGAKVASAVEARKVEVARVYGQDVTPEGTSNGADA